MLPALRLGFVVAPPWALPALTAAKNALDWHCSVPIQLAVASFISDGHLARHVRRMREIYRVRRERLLQLLGGELGAWLEPLPSYCGMHVAALARADADLDAVSEALLARRVRLHALSRYYLGPARAGFVIGYGVADLEDIGRGRGGAAGGAGGRGAQRGAAAAAPRTLPRAAAAAAGARVIRAAGPPRTLWRERGILAKLLRRLKNEAHSMPGQIRGSLALGLAALIGGALLGCSHKAAPASAQAPPPFATSPVAEENFDKQDPCNLLEPKEVEAVLGAAARRPALPFRQRHRQSHTRRRHLHLRDGGLPLHRARCHLRGRRAGLLDDRHGQGPHEERRRQRRYRPQRQAQLPPRRRHRACRASGTRPRSCR